MSPALLFDLDGTLLNSDPIHKAVFEDLWRSRGLVMGPGLYEAKVHGRLNVDVFAELLPDEPDPQALSQEKEAEFRRRLPQPYPALPGVRALLSDAQSRRWPMAVVTNAMRPNAEAMLAATELDAFFEVIVIGEECPHAKPDPFPYREAMRRLGVSAETAIAFEDSPSGIAAAAASGAYTIGIRSTLDDAALRAAGASLTISDFRDPALGSVLGAAQGDFS